MSSNMLFDVDLAPSLGTYWNKLWNVTRNIGTMRNSGVEIGIGGDVIRTKDITWSLRGDISFIKDKVVKLPNGDDWSTSLGSHPWVEGERRYVWWLYSYAGVDMMTGRALYELNKESMTWYSKDALTNEWSYNEDLWQNNLDAAQSEGSLVEIGGKLYTTNPGRASRHLKGTSMPTAFGSFGSNFRWKGLSVGMIFTYQLGGKTNDSFYASLLRAQGDAIHPDLLNRWTGVPEGMTEDSPNRINKSINPELNGYYSSWSVSTSSDRFLTSSTYLAFKNLNINYSLPSKWVQTLRLANVNLGMSVDNIYIFTKRKGMNPTYSISGGMGGTSWVPSRTVAFELKVDF